MNKKTIALLAVFLLLSVQPASAFLSHHTIKIGTGVGASTITGSGQNNIIPLFDGAEVEYEGSIGDNLGVSIYYGALNVPSGGALKDSSAKVSVVGGGLRYYLQPFSEQAFSGIFAGVGAASRKMNFAKPLTPLPGTGTAEFKGLTYYLELGYALVLGPLSAGLSLQGGFMNGDLGFGTGLPADFEFEILKDLPAGSISGSYAGLRGYLSYIF